MTLKHLFALSALAVMPISFLAFADQVEVTMRKPLKAVMTLSQPATFIIENSAGLIDVIEGVGDVLLIEAVQDGSKAVTIHFGEVEPGKFKIHVDYPGSYGGSVIVSRGGSVSVTSLTSRGSVVINNGQVIINGKEVTPDSQSGESAGPVRLRVSVPPKLLASLKLDSASADISVTGAFDGPEANDRQVVLKSASGEIRCEGLCTMGSLVIQTASGDVSLVEVRTTSAQLQTASGDIRLDDVNGIVFTNTASGDVTSDGGAGDLQAKTMSGDVKISDRTHGRITASSMSGDIKFSNPDPSAFEYGSTMSGRIRGQKKTVKPSPKCEKNLSPKEDPFNF